MISSLILLFYIVLWTSGRSIPSLTRPDLKQIRRQIFRRYFTPIGRRGEARRFRKLPNSLTMKVYFKCTPSIPFFLILKDYIFFQSVVNAYRYSEHFFNYLLPTVNPFFLPPYGYLVSSHPLILLSVWVNWLINFSVCDSVCVCVL